MSPNARTIAFGLMAGAASAGLLLLSASGSMGAALLSYAAAFPLALVGLTVGVPAVLVAVLAGTVTATFLSATTAAFYAVVFGLPVAVLARQALLARSAAESGGPAEAGLEWYPPGRLTAWLAGWAAGLLVLAMALTSDTDGGLPGYLTPGVERLLEVWLRANDAGGKVDVKQLPEMAAWIARLMPAVGAISWMVVIAANLTLGQALARRLKKNLRPSPDFTQLELPRTFLVALGLAVLLALVPGTLGFAGKTLAAIGAAAYFLQGLAVVHGLARLTSFPGLILTGVYVVIGVLGFPVLVIVMLGLIEDWFRLRRKFGKTRT